MNNSHAVVDGKKLMGPHAQAAKSVRIKEEPIDLTISVPPKVSGEHGEFLIMKNTVIYEHARQKLYDWRNGIGQAAVQAVDAHFNTHPQKYNSLDAHQKWAAYMLENYRFAYWDTADPDADCFLLEFDGEDPCISLFMV
ncbi:hypothetical protein NEOLEDRAFT_1152598 [Neolentinus lepideus HHB14362 ss-1]|uniref:Uncharacterized protein n=1 Tax=Neolentinus lepideus HHB14362 ss-1 TaxID=1314782 RepID=A0A165MLA9_9AGAM|nr:hypothetical protein NEOLEDRAFT_1152598 [Neolentinus lepideus HHB14362 ss-1]